MRGLSLMLACVAAAAAALLAGEAAFGRMALTLGFPRLATALLDDPAWNGVALYRAGRFDLAEEAFRRAGGRGTFNRGNSLAKLGRYAEAVAVYDAALFRNSGDEDARINRDLIAAMLDPIVGEFREGRSALPTAAASGGAGTPPLGGPSAIKPVDYERARKPIDAMSIAADAEWLATLPDEPGHYLKLRIAAEYQRRLEAGTAAPRADSSW